MTPANAACQRCGGPPGPRNSGCPGCWDTCRAKYGPKAIEPNPCGQPATVLSIYGVMMCQRHADLFAAETNMRAKTIAERWMNPRPQDLAALRKDLDRIDREGR